MREDTHTLLPSYPDKLNKFVIEQSRLQQFGSLEFIAKQVVEGFITGLHKSPFHGFSVEFAEHRQKNHEMDFCAIP